MADTDSFLNGGTNGGAKNVFKAMANPEYFREESATTVGTRQTIKKNSKKINESFAQLDDFESEIGGGGAGGAEDFLNDNYSDQRSVVSERNLSPVRKDNNNNVSKSKRWMDLKHRIRRLNKKLKMARKPESEWMRMPDPSRDNLEEIEDNLNFEEREFRQERFVKKGKTRIIMAGNFIEKSLLALNKWVKIPIDDWTEETLIPSVDDFDEALERLHDMVDGKTEMNPAVELVMIFAMSAATHIMMQMALNNPTVQKAIETHMSKPEVAETFARSFVENSAKARRVPLEETGKWGASAAGGGENPFNFMASTLDKMGMASMFKDIASGIEKAEEQEVSPSILVTPAVTVEPAQELETVVEIKKKKAPATRGRKKKEVLASTETSHTFEF